MNRTFALKLVLNAGIIAIATSALTACGGGGGGALPVMKSPGGPQGVLSTRTLNGSAGFVNAAGLTVYVFDLDLTSPGHSLCTTGSGCTQDWPPVAPPAGITMNGGFSTITRDNGTTQLTYNGRPLYTFAFDSAPGETNGDGVTAFGGQWHIARPQLGGPAPSPTPGGGGY